MNSEELRLKIKAQAHALKGQMPGKKLGHCFDVIAKSYGFRDWNTLSALINAQPEEVIKRIGAIP